MVNYYTFILPPDPDISISLYPEIIISLLQLKYGSILLACIRHRQSINGLTPQEKLESVTLDC